MIPPAPSFHNAPEYTVGDLSTRVKKILEENFSYVRVRGEISGLKRHTSGHVYLTLKDENAAISAVCWRGTYSKLSVMPEDGMEVIATGRITTYPGRSQYQLVLEQIELAGRGALLKLLEERKERLRAEGLFDISHKKQLPFLPAVIGVVTSLTGAVIRDILHRLQDRFPVHVIVWPVLVQGEGAADQVAKAIAGFESIHPRPDLLIVARGGGSFEDLLAFNEESVIRAAFNSTIPLISAIGHETDTTLLDLVADQRAPTPTAAAEIAVPVRHELWTTLNGYQDRLVRYMSQNLEERRQKILLLSHKLGTGDRLLEAKMQRLDDLSERLTKGLEKLTMVKRMMLLRSLPRLQPPVHQIQKLSHKLSLQSTRLGGVLPLRLSTLQLRLKSMSQLLEASSFERTLARGFVLVRDGKTGDPLTSVKVIHQDQALSLTFKDGSVEAQVTGK